MMEVFKEYEEKGIEYGISKEAVIEACMIYRDVYHGIRAENLIIRGKNKGGVKAMCLFETLYKRGLLKNMAVVGKMYGLPGTKLRYGRRIVERLMPVYEPVPAQDANTKVSA